MSKINHEEYRTLKSLGDNWKWMARDSNSGNDGRAYAYLEKPFKRDRVGIWSCGKGVHLLNVQSFQFIQWEDEEPYSIQELIDEYFEDEYGYFNMKLSRELEEFIEIEREETEVKKDKEWILERIENYIPLHDKTVGDVIEGILEIAKQLDEPEVLSEEWIERNTSPADDEGRLYVWKRDLQNAIVPKQEGLESKIEALIEDYKQGDSAYNSYYENVLIGGFIEDLKNLVEENDEN